MTTKEKIEKALKSNNFKGFHLRLEESDKKLILFWDNPDGLRIGFPVNNNKILFIMGSVYANDIVPINEDFYINYPETSSIIQSYIFDFKKVFKMVDPTIKTE